MSYHPEMHEKPENYNKNGEVPFAAAEVCLKKFFDGDPDRKILKNGKVLDVACGEGLVTELLYSNLERNAELYACDISENVINYAKAKYRHLNINFFVLDVLGPVPVNISRTFDLVFSNFLLHWISDYRTVLMNFKNMLVENGYCVISFLSHHKLFQAYRIQANNNQWSKYMRDVENFITPYQDTTDPDKHFKDLLEDLGFEKIEVYCEEVIVHKPNFGSQKHILQSIDPFLPRIPKDQHEQYMRDYMENYVNLGGFVEFDRSSYDGGPVNIPNKLLIAFARNC